MSKRIFKAMMAVTLTTLLVCMALFIAILFPYFETQLSDELMNELEYLAPNVEREGLDYLEHLSDGQNRLTLIDADGTVLFDSDADAQLRFTATRTRCWSDSKYDYTETNYSSVRRDGTLGFDAVPVDGSSKIEDDLMESIEPFAMQDAIPFQTAYLAGYVADKYDVSAEDSIERANKRIRRSTEETFQQTVTGYDSVKVDNSSIQLHGGKAKYALFPVWLLSTSWRGENYLFAMNGQTGKFVGDLPVDKGAARKWMLGLTAALSAASYGVMWLLWLARIL